MEVPYGLIFRGEGDQQVFSVRTFYDRPHQIDEKPTLLESIDDWNRRTLWPKVYSHAHDDGTVRLIGEAQMLIGTGVALEHFVSSTVSWVRAAISSTSGSSSSSASSRKSTRRRRSPRGRRRSSPPTRFYSGVRDDDQIRAVGERGGPARAPTSQDVPRPGSCRADQRPGQRQQQRERGQQEARLALEAGAAERDQQQYPAVHEQGQRGSRSAISSAYSSTAAATTTIVIGNTKRSPCVSRCRTKRSEPAPKSKREPHNRCTSK